MTAVHYSIPAAFRPWGCLFLAAFAFAIPEVRAADILAVEVIGLAPGDSAAAFDEAVANGQREALLQYIEANLPSGMSAALNPILFNPRHYVDSQKVGAVRVQRKTTEVDLGLVLNESKLRRDVASLVAPTLSETVSVLVLTGQRYGNEPFAFVPDGHGQVGLESLIGELPVALAAPGDVLPFWDEAAVAAGLAGDQERAAALGAYAFADVALISRCSIQSQPAEQGVNLIQNHVTLIVQVYDCRARDLIREFQSEAQVRSLQPEAGIEQAVNDAVEKIRGQLRVETIFACARAGLDDRIRITIEGLADTAQFDVVTEWLGAQLGPEAVDAIHYHPDRARIAVAYLGPVSSFVNALMSARFEGFELLLGPAVARDISLEARQTNAP